jgi:hypothetical protein
VDLLLTPLGQVWDGHAAHEVNDSCTSWRQGEEILRIREGRLKRLCKVLILTSRFLDQSVCWVEDRVGLANGVPHVCCFSVTGCCLCGVDDTRSGSSRCLCDKFCEVGVSWKPHLIENMAPSHQGFCE